jgi:hypothetical protein
MPGPPDPEPEPFYRAFPEQVIEPLETAVAARPRS